MKALTDEESDATEQSFPVYVHGMLKMESFSGALRPEDERARSPSTCRPSGASNESRLEVRYSPTLAGAMVDALPYLVDYPYGCTEQTLNRFVPTVITQKVLHRHGPGPEGDPGEAHEPQRAGDRRRRRARRRSGSGSTATRCSTRQKSADGQGRRAAADRNAALRRRLGLVQRLGRAELPAHDGGRRARSANRAANDVALVPGVLERGVAWLKTLSGPADRAAEERAGQARAQRSRTRPRPTISTRWSTWCWSMPT